MRQNKLVLFFLMLLFIAPGVFAYLFYMNPTWLAGATTNKGHFISPPQKLSVFGGKPMYRMVFWHKNTCDHECLLQLDKIARVRVALGRRYYSVESWLLQGDMAEALSPEARAALLTSDVHVKRLSAKESKRFNLLGDNPTIFIVDQNDYFILRFDSVSQPDELFHDIKHLLTTDKASN